MRCAVHPSRPAVDSCPVCARPRCRADADMYGATGCAACTQPSAVRTPAGRRELVVRGGLGALLVAYLGGWVGTQYVRVHLMSLLAPGLAGVVAAWVVTAVARDLPRRIAYGLAAAGAVLAAALAFRIGPDGGYSPLHPLQRVGPPYLVAVVGVALWPLLLSGPRRQPPGDGVAAEDETEDGIAL